MADIDRIVTVNISRQTTVPSMASFSDLIIVQEFLKATPNPDFGTDERVRVYGSLTEIAAAGFADTTFVYKAAAKVFAQNPRINRVYVGRKLTGADGTETWTEALDAIALDNSNWYGIVIASRVQADQEEVAAWVEANQKLFGIGTADSDLISGTGDIAEVLNTSAYDRSFVLYHPDVGGGSEPVPEAAWFGKMFPDDPGSATWAYKTLAGVPVYALTTGQINTALDKKANIYTSISDVSITQFGTVASGEYIDIIHGLDWLKARIQQKIFTPLVQQKKVPFTDGGIQGIVAQLKSALDEAVTVGLLNPDGIEVTYPLAADVSPADKADRTLPDLKFTAILAGAIHKTQIDGTVTL